VNLTTVYEWLKDCAECTHSTLEYARLKRENLSHPRPLIFHSDNGVEYNTRSFSALLERTGVTISRSKPCCPWENGYQESFYSQFKADFGDPSRFKTLGELVLAVYQTIWQYNHTRIHSALKMSPMQFALQAAQTYNSGNKEGVQ